MSEDEVLDPRICQYYILSRNLWPQLEQEITMSRKIRKIQRISRDTGNWWGMRPESSGASLGHLPIAQMNEVTNKHLLFWTKRRICRAAKDHLGQFQACRRQ